MGQSLLAVKQACCLLVLVGFALLYLAELSIENLEVRTFQFLNLSTRCRERNETKNFISLQSLTLLIRARVKNA